MRRHSNAPIESVFANMHRLDSSTVTENQGRFWRYWFPKPGNFLAPSATQTQAPFTWDGPYAPRHRVTKRPRLAFIAGAHSVKIYMRGAQRGAAAYILAWRPAMSTWGKKYVVVDELRSSEEKEKITERRRSAHLRKMLRCGSNGLCCHGEIILQNPDVHAAVSKRRYKITRLIIVRALAKYYNVNRIDAFVTSN